MAATDNPTFKRLDEEIRWYDEKSTFNQRRFKLVKGAQLLSAAAIPVVATIDFHAAIAATLGALVVVLEGFQQLNQYQQNWSSFRSTAEALKHEKFLYLAGAGPYRRSRHALPLLADRIEGLISQEHAKWVSAREEASHALGEAEPGSD
jgi:Protein of unknown function (DUF4231)